MTEKESIKIEKYLLDGYKKPNYKLAEKIMEVVEKQIPKKVIEQTEEDREFIDFICPFCKTTLQQKIKSCFSQRFLKNTIYKYSFCLHCGQALDWSDTE